MYICITAQNRAADPPPLQPPRQVIKRKKALTVIFHFILPHRILDFLFRSHYNYNIKYHLKTSTHILVRYLPEGECKMSERCIVNECLGTTGFSYTLSLINGKYKMIILYTLMEFGVVRFNEMKKYIKDISYKTLSSTLKELEADRLVHREEYPQIPPKVEYSLTELGRSLIPILDGMCEWGDKHRQS